MLSQRTGFSLKMKELFLPLLKLPRTTYIGCLSNYCVNFEKNSGKNQITCSSAHRVFIRKRNFQILAESFLNPNLKSNLTY